MKFIDKLALKIFSIIIFVIAIGIILVMTGILDVNMILDKIVFLTDGENTIKVTVAILAVLMLLAIKGFFFTSKAESNGKEGIVLENSNGKLVISKESLDNLIASVIKDVPGAEIVASKTILDRDRNLIIYVTAVVSKDVMIKEVSNELQLKIKDAMKKTADLEVKEVNIKIKNITSKRVKGLPAPGTEENKVEEIESNNNEENAENVEIQNNEQGLGEE